MGRMLRIEFDKDEMTQNEIDLLGDIFGPDDVKDLLETTDVLVLQLEAK